MNKRSADLTQLWKPVKPTGSGRARRWKGVTDKMWIELHDACVSLPMKDRAKLLAQYHISYPSLCKYAGKELKQFSGHINQMTKQDMVDVLNSKILEAELNLINMKSEVERLKLVDDELIDIIRSSM